MLHPTAHFRKIQVKLKNNNNNTTQAIITLMLHRITLKTLLNENTVVYIKKKKSVDTKYCIVKIKDYDTKSNTVS